MTGTTGLCNVKKAGSMLVLVLVLTGVFLTVLSSFVWFISNQNEVVNYRFEQQRATEIAEAGLNYYKWYLAHYPGDTSGVGTYIYNDPELGPIGEFTLSVASTTYCGQVASIDVESTAHTYVNASAVVTVSARYSQPTVAEYSFVNNASVWYGDSRVITGPVHGNQGVKMDGFHNSYVGSGQATFDCTSSFGCSPTVYNADGVYTTSGNATPGLFKFPVSPIDFAGLTIDLTDMKNSAQNAGGIYYGPTTGYGYLADFQSDGTVNIYRVTNTRSYWSYSSADGWTTNERNDITNTSFLATETIDPTCPLLYFEDKLWIEGEINQKVSVAAADLSSSAQTNLVIADDVTYVSGTEAGLLAIAEDDIDIGIDVPNNMVANGIYIAQNGRFGRDHYETSGSHGLPSALDPYVSRSSLTRLGSVVSNLRGGTEWTSGSTHISGFYSRVTSYDRDQVDNPPPLTPATSDVYVLQNWRLK
ncbi:hypothetical protein KC887_06535 [Candidatus Kaiserbacteria bacterium]|nr:hypothetical protein [Candidatus Kaiserbacteria bacterium]